MKQIKVVTLISIHVTYISAIIKNNLKHHKSTSEYQHKLLKNNLITIKYAICFSILHVSATIKFKVTLNSMFHHVDQINCIR